MSSQNGEWTPESPLELGQAGDGVVTDEGCGAFISKSASPELLHD
jgi:hypothetical protein